MSTGNEAAFPLFGNNGMVLELGLTKREYVATQVYAAMIQGMLANPNIANEPTPNMQQRARNAVDHAEALLSELSR
jgi:hypothetical protein